MTTPTPTRPKLTRPAYHLWVAPEGVDPDTATDEQLDYYRVTINHADQLRAELEAGRLKIDQRKHMMHLTSLWLWAAMVRAHGYSEPFHTWKLQLVAYEPDKLDDDDEPAADDTIRPTEASTS